MTRSLRLHWLDPHDPQEPFPPVSEAMSEPNGLLAIGGDLSVTRLLNAYRHGIFPWFNPDEPILWWAPDPRVIFDNAEVHVSRSLRRTLKRDDFSVTIDRAFEDVIELCARPRERQRGTWLGVEMRKAYHELFRRGYAHSLEVWRRGELIGGIYGLSIGRAFFGESMFSTATDGSKIALACLSEHLQAWHFGFIDAQVPSPHLFRMGATEIPRARFIERLDELAAEPTRRTTWHYNGRFGRHDTHLPVN